MKFLFVVQGEGRGHFMQAIEMHSMLQKHGHEVVACLVGKSPQRKIPQYLYTRLADVKILSFKSPNFVAHPGDKRPSVFFSVIYNVMKLPEFSQTARFLRQTINQYKPDAVINFYDVMLGIANIFHPMRVPIHILLSNALSTFRGSPHADDLFFHTLCQCSVGVRPLYIKLLQIPPG